MNTMNKPRLLDLYCKDGGAGAGYAFAGFDVVGVDIAPQPRYPFVFHQADAIEYVKAHGAEFDVIHASPPCQRLSTMTKRWGRQDDHPDLIHATRLALMETGRPFVIENVRGAPLHGSIMLCGSMFGLKVRRHRYFEIQPMLIFLTPPCNHSERPVAVYGHSGGSSKRDGLTFGGVDTWKEAMGIHWMIGDEMAEAIPPVYTEYIGRILMQWLKETK